MAILKNEPLFPFTEGNYAKPNHIIIAGSDEEIGYELASLAKEKYDCTLEKYDEPIYGEARREFFKRNWPAMNERAKGISRTYGLSEDDNEYDTTALPYDVYDSIRGGQALSFATCSGLVLPIEKSDTHKGVYIARNNDLWPLPVWSVILGKTPPEGAYGAYQRANVIESHPDKGYKNILIGSHDLLTPFGDGINEKGLYFSTFADPNGVGEVASPMAGGKINGLSYAQLGAYLLSNCATVEDAKKAILTTRVIQVGMCIHMLIADRDGNATVFEIDKLSQAYVFTDRKPGEPLFCTNHPLSAYPDSSKFPAYSEEAEHNTFYRMNLLNKTYAGMKAPFKKSDAEELVNVVHCAFIDDKKAEAAFKERTLINTNCDLSKPEITVRFYLGDEGEIPGTNHMKTRMSEPFTFGFD